MSRAGAVLLAALVFGCSRKEPTPPDFGFSPAPLGRGGMGGARIEPSPLPPPPLSSNTSDLTYQGLLEILRNRGLNTHMADAGRAQIFVVNGTEADAATAALAYRQGAGLRAYSVASRKYASQKEARDAIDRVETDVFQWGVFTFESDDSVTLGRFRQALTGFGAVAPPRSTDVTTPGGLADYLTSRGLEVQGSFSIAFPRPGRPGGLLFLSEENAGVLVYFCRDNVEAEQTVRELKLEVFDGFAWQRLAFAYLKNSEPEKKLAARIRKALD